jgi:single-stranded DNA-binding protein
LGQSGRRIVGWFVSKGRNVYVERLLTTREYEAKGGSGKRSSLRSE